MAGRNPRVPVDIVARTDRFERDVKKATKAAAASVAAFGAAAAAGIAAAAKATIDLSAELNKLAKDARRVGVSVEEFQKVGGAIGHLTDGTVNIAQAMQDFQKRTGEALPDLVKLADEIAAMENPADRTARAMELFGERAGRNLAGALSEGGAAVQAAIDRVEAAGIVSTEAARQAEALQDAVDDAKQTFLAFRVDALAPLMPVMTGVLGAAQELTAELRQTGAVTSFGDAVARTFIEVVMPAVTVGAGQSVKALRGMATTLALVDVSMAKVGVAGRAVAVGLEFISGRGQISGATLAELEQATGALTEAQIRLDLAVGGFAGTEDEAAAAMDRVIAKIREQQAAFDSVSGSARGGGGTATGDGGPSPLPGTVGSADRIANVAAESAELEQVAVDHAAKLIEIDEAQTARAKALAAQRRDAALSALNITLGATQATFSAIAELHQVVTDGQISNLEEGSQAHKDALREQWEAQTAIAITQAALNVAMAISNAFANAPNPIVGGVMAAISGTVAGINLAAVIAKAAQGPSFHSGGDVGPTRLGLPAGSPDEVNATLLRGERVQSRAEVRAGSGPSHVTTVFRVGPRTVDAMTTEAIRTGSGSTFDAARTGRRRVGRFNPHARGDR